MYARFSAGVRFSKPPLRQLDLHRLAADETPQSRDLRLVLLEQIGRMRLIVVCADLELLDPDADQVAREVVALAKTAQRLGVRPC